METSSEDAAKPAVITESSLEQLYQDFYAPARVRLKVTWAMRVEEYIESTRNRLAPGTVFTITKDLTPFALYVGYRDLSGAIVLSFIKMRFDRISTPASRSRIMLWLKSFLTWAENMGYLEPTSLSRLVPRVHIPFTKAVTFTQEQYEKLRDAARGTKWCYPIVFAYRTGARLSDACLLRWSNVDLENLLVRYIPFKTRKSQREAICPFQSGGDLHEVLLDLHEARRSKTEDAFIDPSLAGRYSDNLERRISMDFVAFCHTHGVRGLSFHKLRNSFMSRVVNGGVPFAQATQMTGLASESVFHRYAKPDLGVLRNAIRTMDALEQMPDSKDTGIQMLEAANE